LCDRVIIMMNGQIRADARLAELGATNNAILVLQRPIQGLAETLSKLKNVRRVEALDGDGRRVTYRVHGSEGIDLCPALFEIAREMNWPLRELRPDSRTLESVFNELATTNA
ncbi:MAG: hypothetical protein RMN25_08835, partial [Anaerolineae bacterium]|nr:hypothetical protein [Thermoflexales bacterium]MDW8407879.1 hypothetical protein [Anaerolineae bacterium]